MIVVNGAEKHHGYIFSLLNPPVPLGGNVISLDIYEDELPAQRKSIFIATSDEVVNLATISESRPIAFKPYQSARFLVIKDGGLDDNVKHKILIMSRLEGFEEITIPFKFTDYVSGYQKDRIHITPDSLTPIDLVVSSEDTMFKNFASPLVLSGKSLHCLLCKRSAFC